MSWWMWIAGGVVLYVGFAVAVGKWLARQNRRIW